MEQIKQTYIPAFQKLAEDEQDNVRVLAVSNVIEFKHIFNQEECVSYYTIHFCLRENCAYRYRQFNCRRDCKSLVIFFVYSRNI